MNRVKKGETVFIPIIAINRDKSIWGEDAKEFKSVPLGYSPFIYSLTLLFK